MLLSRINRIVKVMLDSTEIMQLNITLSYESRHRVLYKEYAYELSTGII